MLTERKHPLATGIPFTAAICLTLASFLIISCGDSSTDSTPSSNATTSKQEEPEFGVVLRANPNPVPGGTDVGKTTITWQTGSESEADIFFFDGKDEALFASGSKGSKEASIRPGSNEFRLYNKGERKLVTQLIVTMPGSSASASSAGATPAASASK